VLTEFKKFLAKWQAEKCSGATSSSAGSILQQISSAYWHRGWNLQPGGGFTALGTSPESTIRILGALGSGIGMADRSAWCRGLGIFEKFIGFS